LPFVNATGDAGMEYLSDGLAESLISSLSEVRSLRVMAPGTVFAYKGRAADPRAVGRDLKVAAVLQGKVQRQGDTLIVQTDLVATADGAELWGERYNRKLADALSIQIDISREIASKLRVRLSGEVQQVLARHSTTNPDAYENYLKGMYFSKQLSSEGLNAGVKYFEQAIALDPNYALAYVGLAYAYMGAYDWLAPPHDQIPKARAAIDKALELDQSLGDAHAMLAAVLTWYDYDQPAAEREFRRAIELSPDYAIAHEFYGWFLLIQKRFDAGLTEGRRAVELNPLDPEPHAVLGQDLYYAHRYDEARVALLDSIKLFPGYWFSYDQLGFVYQAQGDLTRAMEQFRKARELERSIAEPRAAIAQCYALQGNREAARQALKEMTELSKHSHVAAYDFAMVYAALGDRERALDELEKSVKAQSWYPTFMGLDPKLDTLRSEPKFRELQRRVGVP
jgi:TolB-like protein/Tfp pilus assembly protein PilF